MIAWVDIETSGLDAQFCRILEIGTVVTDDNLNQLGLIERVLRYSLPESRMEPEALRMHQESGLLALCRSSMFTNAVQYEIVDYYKGLGAVAGELMLAGSSVHFDRAFMRRFMPVLERFFHYRQIDVSAIRELAHRWRPGLIEPESRKLHRVLPDLEDTLALAQFYKDQIFNKESQ